MNGRTISELGTRADPTRDQISVDGRPLRLPQELTYILLHKPVGVVTTLSDPEGRRTVRDLLAGVRLRVYPVGRLDYTSSGLLMLTNDGELTMRLMHPRYGIEREYVVKTKGVPDAAAIDRLRRGVRLDRGRGRPASAQVSVEKRQESKAWLRVVVTEGRTHEVRRLCAAVGLDVEKLRRVRYGPLELGDLEPGEYRLLTAAEVTALRRATGLLGGSAAAAPRTSQGARVEVRSRKRRPTAPSRTGSTARR